MLADAANYSYMLRVFVSENAPRHARLASRYLMGGVLLHFFDLKNMHTRADLQELTKLGLVTEAGRGRGRCRSHHQNGRQIGLLNTPRHLLDERSRAAVLTTHLLRRPASETPPGHMQQNAH